MVGLNSRRSSLLVTCRAQNLTQNAKRIVLIIGGGIAAYKCLELIRRARERGIAVRPVMTRAAVRFVTPLSVGAIAGDRVFSDLFDLAGCSGAERDMRARFRQRRRRRQSQASACTGHERAATVKARRWGLGKLRRTHSAAAA